MGNRVATLASNVIGASSVAPHLFFLSVAATRAPLSNRFSFRQHQREHSVHVIACHQQLPSDAAFNLPAFGGVRTRRRHRGAKGFPFGLALPARTNEMLSVAAQRKVSHDGAISAAIFPLLPGSPRQSARTIKGLTQYTYGCLSFVVHGAWSIAWLRVKLPK